MAVAYCGKSSMAVATSRVTRGIGALRAIPTSSEREVDQGVPASLGTPRRASRDTGSSR